MRIRPLLAVGFAALTVFACKDKEVATPRAVFESTVEAGSHTTAECGKTGTFFSIGSFGAPGDDEQPPAPIDDGAAEQQGTVSLQCSVVPDGDGFAVSGFVTLSGATGGSFSVQGHFGASGTQSNISVSLTRNGETFRQSNCTAEYPLPNQTVAAGRVWANFACGDVSNSSTQKVCSGHGQFRFENCSQ